MNRQPAKRSSLFLLELIIAILFFCLASAVCVRFFVKSHTTAQDSEDLNHAVEQAVSVAEIVRSDADLYACLSSQFPDSSFSASGSADGSPGEDFSCEIYYGQDWQPCAENACAYRLQLACTVENAMRCGEISVIKNGTQDASQDTVLYTLEVQRYLAKEAQTE